MELGVDLFQGKIFELFEFIMEINLIFFDKKILLSFLFQGFSVFEEIFLFLFELCDSFLVIGYFA